MNKAIEMTENFLTSHHDVCPVMLRWIDVAILRGKKQGSLVRNAPLFPWVLRAKFFEFLRT